MCPHTPLETDRLHGQLRVDATTSGDENWRTSGEYAQDIHPNGDRSRQRGRCPRRGVGAASAFAVSPLPGGNTIDLTRDETVALGNAHVVAPVLNTVLPARLDKGLLLGDGLQLSLDLATTAPRRQLRSKCVRMCTASSLLPRGSICTTTRELKPPSSERPTSLDGPLFRAGNLASSPRRLPNLEQQGRQAHKFARW